MPEVRGFAFDGTTVYAGTADGMHRSIDGGMTWQARGLGGRRVHAIVQDAQGDASLYAGTDGQGVWRSEDGGASWQRFNEGLGPLRVRMQFVTF